MDVFGAQASARSRSRWLIVLFIVALALMGVGLHVAVTGVAMLFGVVPSLSEPNAPVRAMIALLWAGVLLGTLFRWLDVRDGGEKLARRLGAAPLAEHQRREGEGALGNIVAEMSIAAAVPAPAVFVMSRESSLNAFVLGTPGTGHVLIVTAGALEAFDRDQLQAVVAHEFGHIATGDTLVNMRLLVALGGLHALDEIGQLWQSRADQGQIHPGVVLGGALRLFASLGVLLGSVLRAAVSRQREYLADAQAVQFTRDPSALAGALHVLAHVRDEVALHDHRGAELAHLCFSGGTAPWWRRTLASHPPLSSRIAAIDPSFSTRMRVRARAASRARSRTRVRNQARSRSITTGTPPAPRPVDPAGR